MSLAAVFESCSFVKSDVSSAKGLTLHFKSAVRSLMQIHLNVLAAKSEDFAIAPQHRQLLLC